MTTSTSDLQARVDEFEREAQARGMTLSEFTRWAVAQALTSPGLFR